MTGRGRRLGIPRLRGVFLLLPFRCTWLRPRLVTRGWWGRGRKNDLVWAFWLLLLLARFTWLRPRLVTRGWWGRGRKNDLVWAFWLLLLLARFQHFGFFLVVCLLKYFQQTCHLVAHFAICLPC